MLKKVLISIGILVVILIIAYFYLDNRNRTLSPMGEEHVANAELTVDLTYSRPSVRDRLIFGAESDGALVPYGNYWRLGANEATEVTFDKDVLFNGVPVAKGTYRMYAIPGPESFEIRLSTHTGQWGAFEPDYEQDVLSTQVPVEWVSKVEQFTITLDAAPDGVVIIVEWDNLKLEIPVQSQ